MNRRNFIKASILSTAGVMLSESLFAFSDNRSEQLINLPSGVNAVVNGKMVSLKSSGKEKWVYENIIVRFINTGKSIEVFVTAPNTRLSFIILNWKINHQISQKILNDHWERTYGDVSWHQPDKSEILPWYFFEFNGKHTNAFGVKTKPAAFCFWQVNDDAISLHLDTRSGSDGVQLGNRKLKAAEIVAMKSNSGEPPFNASRRFARIMCPQSRLAKQPVYGINDWYFSYGKTSEKLILEHTELIASMAKGLNNRPFSVIDAGWFKGTPSNPDDVSSFGDDMRTPNNKFPDMKKLSEKIKNIGMRPGLWTRPLCASYKDSESLLMKKSRNTKEPILDPSIPENLERVKDYFRLYKDWDYELVKFDYTSFDIFGKWGFAMIKDKDMSSGEWSMDDSTKTNAEIILNLYNSIREAAGDTYIIGCNTFSHLSAGLFELNRIGDDTSGVDWSRTLNMGVNTLAFRGIHHNIFYASDADCVGLTTKIPWEKNKQWMELVAKSGTPLFISAQPEAVGTDQKEFIQECFKYASSNLPIGEPLDWMENPRPSRWKLDGKVKTFDWN
jgi:alpha-galactosidase